MGTGLFFDFKTIRNLNAPIQESDLAVLDDLHAWIMWSFAGLWVTGIVLIYVRTGFVLSDFSPKLWLKVIIMTLLAANALLIGKYVVPVMRRNVGLMMIDLPRKTLFALTQVAVVSMVCWTLGMALGSSVVLKTAPWDVLIPLALGWAGLLTIVGQTAVAIIRPSTQEPTPSRT